MKTIKGYVSVEDILDRLADEDLEQVKCAYFEDVKFDDGEIEFNMVIDEEDGNDEEWQLDEDWMNIYNDDAYWEYLANSYVPEDDEEEIYNG